MELIVDFFEWAWPRHLNPISWYIRPLFFIPMAVFAWRRKGWWLGGTTVAMLSSFFWFPEPEDRADPAAQAILDMEAELFAQPGWQSAIALGTIPIFLGGIMWAFWRHSIALGLWVINLGIAYKAIWVWINTDFAGFMHVLPIYVIALTVIDVLVLGFAKWRKIPLHPPRKPEPQPSND